MLSLHLKKKKVYCVSTILSEGNWIVLPSFKIYTYNKVESSYVLHDNEFHASWRMPHDKVH